MIANTSRRCTGLYLEGRLWLARNTTSQRSSFEQSKANGGSLYRTDDGSIPIFALLRPTLSRPRWLKKHWNKMKTLKVHVCFLQKQPLACHLQPGGPQAGEDLQVCQKVFLCTKSFACDFDVCIACQCENAKIFWVWVTMPKAIDVFTTTNHEGMINISQQIDRMSTSNGQLAPCVTPGAELWSMRRKRLLSGEVGTYFDSNCFPEGLKPRL